MAEDEKAVFISYAWGGESEEIVNRIDQAVQRVGSGSSAINGTWATKARSVNSWSGSAAATV